MLSNPFKTPKLYKFKDKKVFILRYGNKAYIQDKFGNRVAQFNKYKDALAFIELLGAPVEAATA